jgi:CHAT domain-containing protein
VYLAPDGALARLPWAALPGWRGGVLLKEHALALVPHGPFLLHHLAAAPAGADRATGLLLAVGGVDYEGAPQAPPRAERVAQRSLDLEEGRLRWPYLKGSLEEVERVSALAGRRAVVRRTGRQASTTQLLADLGNAKDPPRWLHLATHGFFAARNVRSALQLDEKAFHLTPTGRERARPGVRNPLVLSGLVLAGANRLVTDPDKEDGGILSAEAVAGLNLDGLELAVLSACETGLGEVAGGEGVFGLQRAFHLAGAKNVVASLWKVDDEATAALMGLFYHYLWEEKRPPLEALRQAQLTLYNHPERIPALARERGPDFEKAARLPATPQAAGRASARLWAGFLLSGAGR